MTEELYTIKQALQEHGFVIHKAQGISMLPLLEEGKDSVCLESLLSSAHKFQIGDVVLFERANGSLVLHRVIQITKKHCYICGDNCNSAEKVFNKQILAVMTGYYKGTAFHSVQEAAYQNYTAQILSVAPKDRTLISPMKPIWEQILSLLRCAITGCTGPQIFDNTDWSKIYKIAKAHSITSILSFVVKSYGCPPEVCHLFQTDRFKTMERRFLFQQEYSRLQLELNTRRIPFILIKGATLSRLYPDESMREFADYDILVSPEADYSVLPPIMHSLGYEIHCGDVHDSYYKPPFLNFEIHKSLFSKEYSFYPYFKDIFRRARPIKDYEYGLTEEDFYCYILAHLYKHYSNSGSGLRSLTDIYLLKKHYQEHNISIPYDLLKRLGLKEFENKFSEIAQKLFERFDSLSYEDISFILTSGTYGTTKHEIANALEKHGKMGTLRIKLLPRLETMKTSYPVLHTLPFLLPLCWIIRLIKCLFRKKSRQYLRLLLKA